MLIMLISLIYIKRRGHTHGLGRDKTFLEGKILIFKVNLIYRVTHKGLDFEKTTRNYEDFKVNLILPDNICFTIKQVKIK